MNGHNQSKTDYGFYVSAFGTALILIWLGVFKSTPTEANAIEPLIANNPLTLVLYKILSIRNASIFVGIVEVIVGILILVSLKFTKLRKIAGIGVLVIFLTTTSFIFTTPGVFNVIDGIAHADFFLLKDIMYVGFGLTLLTKKE